LNDAPSSSAIFQARLAAGLILGLIARGALWYGLSFESFGRLWRDILDRPDGPMTFRFILQPAMAALAAFRDGVKDTRLGRTPYGLALLGGARSAEGRSGRLWEGIVATARILILGVVMDVIYQRLEFQTFYPAQAATIAILLAFVPYLHPLAAEQHDLRPPNVFLRGVVREAIPPTLFFFVGFNFIVLTTNLLLADYGAAVFNFMIATLAALLVGKAVLVANAMPYIRRYDRAPLIRPIPFKTVFYAVLVFFVRLAEHFVDFSAVGRNSPADFPAYLMTTFSWNRFAAVNLWIVALFLIYVTASEVARLFGRAELWRLAFDQAPGDGAARTQAMIRGRMG
jgi:hypothetical protein